MWDKIGSMAAKATFPYPGMSLMIKIFLFCCMVHSFFFRRSAFPVFLSQPDRPFPVIKGAAAVAELSLLFSARGKRPHTAQELRPDVQGVVGREQALHRQAGGPLQGTQVFLRVGRGVAGEQGASID